MWNRIAALMVFATALSLLLIPIETEARAGGGGRGGGGGGGGRGGGGPARGGGGGGAYRGGQTMNRTPTMSRAANRPAPQARQQVQARPQLQARQPVQQGRVQQPRQMAQQRPSAANRAELRNQVNQYANRPPAQNIDRQALAQRTQNFSNNRSNQIAQNRQLSNQVSQRLQQTRPGSNQWFNQNFFHRHNLDPDYARVGGNLWRPAAWATLASWGAWNWSMPYYYDDGGYAYPIATDESTYDYSSPPDASTYTSPSDTTPPVQTQPLLSGQTTAPAAGDWLPLGVFAIASDANTAAQTNRFIQLALNRDGEIAGVLYNSLTDAAKDLTGTVNNSTQMAYWSLANQPGAPVASTGIYNLTQDETPVNVHFSDGSDQVWILVRLQQE